MFVGFTIVLLMTIFLGLFSLTQLSIVNEAATHIGSDWMPSANAALGIKESISRMRSQEAQVVSADNPEDIAKYASRTTEAVENIKKEDAILSGFMDTPEEKRDLEEFHKLFIEYNAISNKIVSLVKEGNNKDATSLLRGDSSKTNHAIRKLIDKMVDEHVEGGKKAYLKGQEIYAKARVMIFSVLIVSTIIGLAFAYWLSAIVSNPLQEAVEFAQTIASGDLSKEVQIRSNDETGLLLQALNDMNHSLYSVVSEVRNGSQQISAASTEIANGNMDLSTRTENQASSLEETASSMEEITSTINIIVITHVKQIKCLNLRLRLRKKAEVLFPK